MRNILSSFPLLKIGLIAFIGLSYSIVSQAKTVSFVREYTYNASENDSKVSARKAALEQLQRAAIEEVGVQVQSSFSNKQEIKKGQLKQEILSNMKTFSQALTKTKVLAEKWNGESFYIKAEIEVDPDGITTAMNTIQASSGKDQCEVITKKIDILWKKSANTERNQALVDIAMKANFDDDCNRWQYGVLSTLTRNTNYPIKAYRGFIFEQLKTVKSYELADLMPKVLLYAIANTGNTTNQEWDIATASMSKIPARRLTMLFSVLTKFKPTFYAQKIKEILALVDDNKLGDPAISEEIALQNILRLSLSSHPKFTAQLYLDNADKIINVNLIAPILRKLYGSAHKAKANDANAEFTALADKAMYYFLDHNEIASLNESAKRSLYDILMPLVNNREEGHQYIKDLLARYPNKFAALVESRRFNTTRKNLFLLKYNLPAVNLCKPDECAKQVRNRKLSTTKQNTYLKYLVAYGEKSRPVEKKIIKLFERAQIMPSSSGRTARKTDLITILSNLETTNETAINLLIKSLQDFDYYVPDKATDALAKIGKPAFDIMVEKFDSSEHLTKLRMLKSIAKMENFPDLIEYLQALPAQKTQALRFALEDAIEAQEDQL